MKRLLLIVLLLSLCMVPSFGEEEAIQDEILVLLEDGTYERRSTAEFVENLDGGMLRAASLESDLDQAIRNASQSDGIKEAYKVYPTYEEDSSLDDAWRFDYSNIAEILNDVNVDLSGSEVRVAVFDSGLNKSLETSDLNVENGYNATGTGATSAYDDDTGHGSHVAGIIGSKIDDDPVDINGIAPGVTIIPVKVLNNGGGDTAMIVSAFQYVFSLPEAERPDVINMSLSYTGYTPDVITEINKAVDTYGMIVVAASGNYSNLWDSAPYNTSHSTNEAPGDGEVARFPAAYSNVMAVGSVTKHPTNAEVQVSDYSNIAGTRTASGNEFTAVIDVVAPGQGIISWSDTSSTEEMSGTSMATPHVSAYAAILKHKYPNMTPSQIRSFINDTAKQHSYFMKPPLVDASVSLDDLIGNGLIDIRAGYDFNFLEDLELTDYIFTYDKYKDSQTIVVPNDTVSVAYTYSSADYGSLELVGGDVSGGSLSVDASKEDFVFKSTYAGYEQFYTLKVIKEGLTLSDIQLNGSSLADFDALKLEYDEGNKEYNEAWSIEGTKATEASTLEYALNDGNYASSIDLNDAIPGQENTVYLKVSDGSDNLVYSVSFYRPGSAKVDNIALTLNVNDQEDADLLYSNYSFDQDTKTVNIDVSNQTSSIVFDITKEEETASVFVNSGDMTVQGNTLTVSNLTDGSNTFEFGVKFGAEGQDGYLEEVYTYNLTLIDISKLTEIYLKVGELNYLTFDEAQASQIITVPDGTVNLKFKAVKASSYATLNYTYGIDTVNPYDGTEAILTFDDTKDIVLNVVSPRAGESKQYTFDIQAAVLDTDSSLSALSVEDFTLNEVFDTNTTNYTLTVPYINSELVVNASMTSDKASMTIDGEEIVGQTGDNTLDLNVGSNTVDVIVKAEDQSTTTYTIDVTRTAPDTDSSLTALSVTDNSLDELFESGTTDYNLTVPYTTSQVEVNATLSSDKASMTIDSSSIAGQTGSKTVALDVGSNTIEVVATAEDLTTTTYVITVTRTAPDTDATLSSLSISGYGISPSFSSDTSNYSLTVENGVSSVTVNATKSSSKSTMTIDGASVESKSKSLSVGSNTVNILVTAEDLSTKNYRVTITREQAPAPDPGDDGGSSGNDSGGGSSSSGGFFFIPPSTTSEPEPEPEDEVDVVKNEDGTETAIVEVSDERIEDDIKDDEQEVVTVLVEEGDQAEVALTTSALEDITESEKPLEVSFKEVTFELDSEVLKGMAVSENLKFVLGKADEKHKDSKVVSEVYELDLQDGDDKLSFDVPVPVVFTYDASKVKSLEDLAIYYLDETSGEWVYVGGKLLEGDKISFEAKHFSIYAIRENNKTFTDIQTHWAKDAIETLASREITSGISPNEFAPDKTLTNAEFLVLLVKVLGLPDYEGSLNYANIKEGDWYEPFFKKAQGADLLASTYGVMMDPNEAIKREEMASLLMDAYFYYTKKDRGQQLESAVQYANDESSVSRHFIEDVRMTYQLGLIVGDNNNNFNPQKGATRAEAAIVIKKLLKLLELM